MIPLLGVLWLARAGAAFARQGSPISEAGLLGRTDILYFEDFETNSSGGAYTEDPKLVGFGRRSLKVMYKGGGHGTEGKPSRNARFSKKLNRIYVRRYVMFERDFDFAAGGKVDGSICFAPGKRWLAGFGGKPSHGDDGFSCRLCWGSRGRMTMYTYHADMTGRYGSDFRGRSRFEPGVWQCVELMIKINTIDEGAAKGNNDGEVRLWVDGKLDGERDGIRFRDLPTMGLDNWSYGFYFGGTWTCPKDQYIYMDNVVVAHNYIGPAVFRRPRPRKRVAKNIGAKNSRAKKIEMPKRPGRRKPKPGAVQAWDAKLRARLRGELAAGGRVRFSVTAFQQRFEVLSADEAGTLRLGSPVTEVDMSWPKLEITDRRNLALALLREGNPADHCLVAFYMLAAGEERLGREHLDRCRDLGAEVEASFETVAGSVAAGRSAEPVEDRKPKERVARQPRRPEAEKQPPRPETDRTDRAAAKLFREAETAFIDGDAEGAKELFEKILGQHPGSAFASKAREYLEMLE